MRQFIGRIFLGILSFNVTSRRSDDLRRIVCSLFRAYDFLVMKMASFLKRVECKLTAYKKTL